jgi:hypothetical protein
LGPGPGKPPRYPRNITLNEKKKKILISNSPSHIAIIAAATIIAISRFLRGTSLINVTGTVEFSSFDAPSTRKSQLRKSPDEMMAILHRSIYN